MPKLEAMRQIVANHPVTHNRFLEKFRNGSLTKVQVVKWAKQQFYFSISLPSAFAALYARTPDKYWEVKRGIVPLFDVEAWAAGTSQAHSTCYIELLTFLDLDPRVLTAQEPKEYTKTYIKARLNLCLNRPIVAGLAAIALGNEILNLYIFDAYRKGVNKITELEDCPTGYFDAHIRDENYDFGVFQSVFDAVARDDSDLRLAELAVIELLDARIVFFDALSQDLGI